MTTVGTAEDVVRKLVTLDCGECREGGVPGCPDCIQTLTSPSWTAVADALKDRDDRITTLVLLVGKLRSELQGELI